MSTLNVNNIAERTADSGVTIEGVLFKDSQINSSDIFTRRNYIINGNFDIWQRGTSFGSDAGYTADRWRNNLNGGTIARDQGSFTVGQTDVPNNPQYYYDFNRTVANTATNLFLEQRIENVRTLSSETATVSFWAKYTSNAPTSLNIRFLQNFGSGGSSAVGTNLTTTQTLTTSWTKYTYTATIPSISGKTVGAGSYLAIQFQNANLEVFDIQIAQVQVEKGSVATDFETLSIAETQSLCNRYYQLYIEGIQAIMTGAYYSSTALVGVINFEEMRVAPSIEVVTGTNYYRFWRNNTSDDFNDFGGSGAAGKKSANLQTNSNVSGTAGQSGSVWGNNANAKISLDAEL